MRRLLPLLALALLLPLASCDSTTPEESIAGTYALVSINGTPLPMLLVDQADLNVHVTSGAVILHTDGTFVDRTTYLVDQGGTAQSQDDIYTGKFTKSATGATLNPDGYDPYEVSITGSKMSQVIGDYELQYSK